MKATFTATTAKWAAIAAVCTLLLSACGTKPTEQPGASGGASQTPSGQQTQQPANNTPAAQQPAAKKSWTTPPEMKIDVKKTYQATVATTKGTFKIDLFAKDAPKTVNNFVFLAKEGFYQDIIFHRVISTFMIQTGDPTGTGRGGPGYKFEDELKTPYKYEPGIVAMANSGPNTNGSQFFICSGVDCQGLNKKPDYSIFGKVSEGMDVIQKIATTPVNGEAPKEKIAIQSVTITEK
ncbi:MULTISPECIES: peptidylprolyl isomerase [Paenibacillus]|uniref:Peptidyl-prolyl cis-trans isomerase n=1 Tax=Paenibacillus radicis (ex Xue et al. 2023) TaxID=2972489 RepID=A0ABT1YI36_9BACL|nr:peptidylprolyl isomerase [Paenibacillus radicis (ex Xue et al. 2023)]MCR8631918.1 peptidylprolyl isomerase [Paenibacillus radicis (ex Xue et al. 2023)]